VNHLSRSTYEPAKLPEPTDALRATHLENRGLLQVVAFEFGYWA
jgi:hypothetical protein